MPSIIISSYFKDKSVPKQYRQQVWDDLHSGKVTEEALEKALKKDYAGESPGVSMVSGIIDKAVPEASIMKGMRQEQEATTEKVAEAIEQKVPFVGGLISEAAPKVIEQQKEEKIEAFQTPQQKAKEMLVEKATVTPFGKGVKEAEELIEAREEAIEAIEDPMERDLAKFDAKLKAPIRNTLFKLGIPVVKGAEALVDLAMKTPLPVGMPTEEGLKLFASPNEIIETFVEATPEEAKTAVIEKVKPVAEQVQRFYEGLDPMTQQNLKEAGVFGEIILTALGGAAAKKPVKAAIKRADELIEGIPKVEFKVLTPEKVEQTKKKVDDLVGKITLGTDERAIKKSKSALAELDTTAVSTYQDLKDVAADKISVLAKEVDTILEKAPGATKLDDLAVTTKVGDKVVSQNFVAEALDNLEELYTKIKSPADVERIKQLRNKAIDQGLTPLEINQLAREYGVEFKAKAFTQKGDPRTTVNAEAFENVRKGVKNTMKQNLPEGAAPVITELDKQMSNLYTLQNASDNMVKKVKNVVNKLEERGLIAELGRKLGKAVDVATFGGLKSFVTSLLLQGGRGLKTLDALSIEKKLKENLKKLDKMLEKADDEVKKDLLSMADTLVG